MTDDQLLEELAETLTEKKPRGRQPKAPKPLEESKPYRTSGYSVADFCHLPYAQRAAIDRECDAQAGLVFETGHHAATGIAFTVGHRTNPRPAPISPSKQKPEPVMNTASNSNNVASLGFEKIPSLPSWKASTNSAPEAVMPMLAPAPPKPTPEPITDGCHVMTTKGAEVPAGWAAVASEPQLQIVPSSVVYQTTDYDRFHLIAKNRPVDLQHVRKLVQMISKSNLLHVKPLDVTEDMGVIDGQHRLAAARELGVPVFYRIGLQLSESDIMTLNVAQKNWAGTDYLHSWASEGKPDYVALQAFRERHPTLSFSNAKLLLGGTAHNQAEEFRNGLWKVGQGDKTLAAAELVAEMVERIASEARYKTAMHTGSVAAIYHCVVNVPGFDANEMIRQILKRPRELQPCSSQKQFLTMLQEIYNYQAREANRLRFV